MGIGATNITYKKREVKFHPINHNQTIYVNVWIAQTKPPPVQGPAPQAEARKNLKIAWKMLSLINIDV